MRWIDQPFPVKGLVYPKSDEKPPFMTWSEIKRRTRAGADAELLWECLYLDRKEIEALLSYAVTKPAPDWVYPMLATAAYGIRMVLCYQALGQLKRCFPQGQDETVLSNSAQIFIGINDNATADYVSAHIGDTTINVTSGSTSWGSSNQSTQGQHPSTSKGDSYNSSSSWK